jgi:hypothetical protein
MAKLQDLLNYASPYKMPKCPVCCNNSLYEAEWVEHAKTGPDFCEICGWTESNGTEMYPDNSDYVEACWRLQIAPYEHCNLDRMSNA